MSLRGLSNAFKTQSTTVSQQQNCFSSRGYTWSDPVSPNLKSIEMLWHDLKRAIDARRPKNIAELKQFSKEECSKIPPDSCAGLICN